MAENAGLDIDGPDIEGRVFQTYSWARLMQRQLKHS